jgi:hypothetical protein
MADVPDGNLSIFMWAVGGFAAVTAAGYGALRRSITRIWEHNDRHTESHVRNTDLEEIRELLIATEQRSIRALRESEARIMAELRPVRDKLGEVSETVAGIKARMA